MADTSQQRFNTPPRTPRFEKTTSAVERRVWGCDGHAYEHCIEYDLHEASDRMPFEGKLDTFTGGERGSKRTTATRYMMGETTTCTSNGAKKGMMQRRACVEASPTYLLHADPVE